MTGTGRIQLPVVATALAGAGLLWLAAAAQGPRHGAAALIGMLAGLALHHAAFGFSSAWRQFLRARRGAGLRAQFLLIGLICLVSFPLIGLGQARGVVMPVGLAPAIGAFAFGIGMQLGGGCASGTLYAAGGGSVRMLLTLAAFIAGSAWATWHWPVWAALPGSRAGYSLIAALGWPAALAAMLALLGALGLLTALIERRRHGGLAPMGRTVSLLRGPWSLTAGAAVLAAVGALWFAVLGQPWGVTYGFAVWGAQAAQALGLDPAALDYWQGWRAADLAGGPLSAPVNASNLGIMAGALLAAGLAGRFRPRAGLSGRDIATAIAGGLLMGYGARLAHGCNIGAYLGGVTSGSLHGLWWLAWAMAGSALAVRLRAWLGMDPATPALQGERT